MNNEFKCSDFDANEVADMCKSCMERDVRTIIKTLDLYELEQVSEREDIPYALQDLARWLWRKRVEDSKPVEKNLSISELLKYFCNKRSKKVQIARKQLQSRFEFLSFEEQLAVLRCLLEDGTFNDAVFCSKYLLKSVFWTKDKITQINYQKRITLHFITAMEKKRPNTYKLSLLVARRLPREFVLNCYKTLKDDATFPERMNIIRNLVMRLAEDESFEIDKSLLSASDYACICYKSNRPITDQEAEDALYMNIVDKLNSNSLHYIPTHYDRWVDPEFNFYDEPIMKAVCGNKKVLIEYMKWKDKLYNGLNDKKLCEGETTSGEILISALPEKYKKRIRDFFTFADISHGLFKSLNV